eukprot:CAMPEP_0115030588 /NCGR_PEP_ID=MMETSP0216-20121206/37907_1 /TAXON_ID=223996 /ORGANISM="Protocruzia adherens, Strain Boccale" /LENGTH=277 /DNA_ID=CAMNT_0002407835 /DNA_START=1027 /DNA_END=1860 /DNA_ORIENTATION=+
MPGQRMAEWFRKSGGFTEKMTKSLLKSLLTKLDQLAKEHTIFVSAMSSFGLWVTGSPSISLLFIDPECFNRTSWQASLCLDLALLITEMLLGERINVVDSRNNTDHIRESVLGASQSLQWQASEEVYNLVRTLANPEESFLSFPSFDAILLHQWFSNTPRYSAELKKEITAQQLAALSRTFSIEESNDYEVNSNNSEDSSFSDCDDDSDSQQVNVSSTSPQTKFITDIESQNLGLRDAISELFLTKPDPEGSEKLTPRVAFLSKTNPTIVKQLSQQN